MTVLYLQQKDQKKGWGNLDIVPLVGKRRNYELDRTVYTLIGSFSKSVQREGNTIYLPMLKGDEGTYQLLRIEDKLRLTVKSGNTFSLNGNKCFDAFIDSADRIFIGGNHLSILSSSIIKRSDELPLPPEVLTSELPIFLEGETGTGKSRMAKMIHENSLRAHRSFISLNISALSPSLLESELFGHIKGAFTGAIGDKKGAILSAKGGTLFLDEIDSLPFDTQIKLLLFLDSFEIKPVGADRWIKSDVRLIFATGTPIEKLVEQKKLRKDFYYRLNSAYSVRLPRLNEVSELIEQFCMDYMQQFQVSISYELITFYKTVDWPGNYRQLKGHLDKKRILAGGKKIVFNSFDNSLYCTKVDNFYNESDGSFPLADLKKDYIKKIFYRNGGSCKLTATQLKISLATVRSTISDVTSSTFQAA